MIWIALARGAKIVPMLPVPQSMVIEAVMVITPQPAYLDEVKKWVDRLDKAGGDGGGLQFYVYNLSNQRAEKLGPLLQQAFTGRASHAAAAPELGRNALAIVP